MKKCEWNCLPWSQPRSDCGVKPESASRGFSLKKTICTRSWTTWKRRFDRSFAQRSCTSAVPSDLHHGSPDNLFLTWQTRMYRGLPCITTGLATVRHESLKEIALSEACRGGGTLTACSAYLLNAAGNLGKAFPWRANILCAQAGLLHVRQQPP